MALTEKEQVDLQRYLEDKIKDSAVLSEYASVSKNLDTIRNFKAEDYGKGGTFSVTGLSANSSVASMALSGISISLTGVSIMNKIGYLCANGGQYLKAGKKSSSSVTNNFAAACKMAGWPVLPIISLFTKKRAVMEGGKANLKSENDLKISP